MKKLLLITLLAPMIASATCQNVYDPMNGKWAYVCTPNPIAPQAPVCQNQYDPMNGVWVMVCH